MLLSVNGCYQQRTLKSREVAGEFSPIGTAKKDLPPANPKCSPKSVAWRVEQDSDLFDHAVVTIVYLAEPGGLRAESKSFGSHQRRFSAFATSLSQSPPRGGLMFFLLCAFFA